MSRRTRLAAIGGAVAAVLVLMLLMMTPDDRSDITSGSAPGSRASGAAAGEAIAVPDVNLELLRKARRSVVAPERNPFRFRPKPAPPPPRPSAPPPKPAAAGPPKLPAPTGPPPPAPIPLRYIGLVDAPTQSGRVAIVSDGRGNIFYGKEGDIIEGRYKVLRVSPDLVELSHLDGQGRQTIRLSGQ